MQYNYTRTPPALFYTGKRYNPHGASENMEALREIYKYNKDLHSQPIEKQIDQLVRRIEMAPLYYATDEILPHHLDTLYAMAKSLLTDTTDPVNEKKRKKHAHHRV